MDADFCLEVVGSFCVYMHEVLYEIHSFGIALCIYVVSLNHKSSSIWCPSAKAWCWMRHSA